MDVQVGISTYVYACVRAVFTTCPLCTSHIKYVSINK